VENLIGGVFQSKNIWNDVLWKFVLTNVHHPSTCVIWVIFLIGVAFLLTNCHNCSCLVLVSVMFLSTFSMPPVYVCIAFFLVQIFQQKVQPALLADCKGQETPYTSVDTSNANWWPCLETIEYGAPHFKCSLPAAPAKFTTFESNHETLFKVLLEAIATAKSTEPIVVNHGIRCQRSQNSMCPGTVWMHRTSNKLLGICAEISIDTKAPPEAVLWALYDTKARMQWDSSTLLECKLLSTGIALHGDIIGGVLGDVVYLKIRLPLLTARDMVQERFITQLQDGSFALAIKSCSAARSETCGYPETRHVVRACTHIAGYVVKSNPSGGILMVTYSEGCMGGTLSHIPQEKMRNPAKYVQLQFGKRLENHCNAQQKVQ